MTQSSHFHSQNSRQFSTGQTHVLWMPTIELGPIVGLADYNNHVQESSIPANAEEVIQPSRQQDGYAKFCCIIDGHIVGIRVRDENGALIMERGLKNDVAHGVEHEWDPDGSLIFETRWVDGKEHGVAKQWCCGNLLGTYAMNSGTGVDLWRNCDGSLSEERHCQDGLRHGFERWWNGDDRTVSEESHFKHSGEHGIFRRWTTEGKLRRGFPKYYVEGKQVSKRHYEKAAAIDPSLPPFRENDNFPARELPA